MPYIAIKAGLPYEIGQVVPVEQALHWNKVFAYPQCKWVDEDKKIEGRPEPEVKKVIVEPLPEPEPVKMPDPEKKPRGWNFKKKYI